MVAGRRRGGKPRTEAERAQRHGGTPPPRGTGLFCKRLDTMIKDETKAPTDYRKLSKTAPLEVKIIINTIISQENKHRETLKTIQERYCK